MPIYMKYGKMKGDVTAKGHEGWIELQSAQMGVHRNITSPSGRGVNRDSSPAVQEIVITKYQDSSSTELFREGMWGGGADVEIHFLKTDDPNPYLVIKLKNTLIANYSVSGHGGDIHGRPMESLSLNFTSIEYAAGGPKNTQKQSPPPQMLQWHLGEEP